MKRDVRPEDVAGTVVSPGMFLVPPIVWHAERIPPDIEAAMRPTWETRWFTPRPVRMCVFEDVFVGHDGLAFTREFDVIAPSVGTQTIGAVDQMRDWLKAGNRTPRLHGAFALCRRRGADNYGHWTVEMLTAAWLIARHWAGPIRYMVQGAPGLIGQATRDSLACLGVLDRTVEVGAYPMLVDRLVLVDGMTEHGAYMSPLVMTALDEITAAIPPGRDSRLMVTRGPALSRQFVDQPDLLAQAEAAGFAVIDPATMPFAAQVAAFKGARRVVGAMGAAMTNIAFASPGAEVAVMAPAGMPDTFYWFICGLRGHAMIDVRCEQVGWFHLTPWDTAIRFDAADRAPLFGPGWPAAPPDTSVMQQALAAAFDADFYRRRHPDVAQAGVDPLLHFLEHGWREGRAPSAAFDPGHYLAAYRDVAASGMNPVVHYVAHGAGEGRRMFPAE